MSLINNKRERIRFLKFSIVGMTGTIVDFGVMNFLRLVINTPLIWAQGISFVCAVINNFLWNRYWTYPESRSKAAPKQLLQFLIINLIGILIRSPLVPWLDKYLLYFLDGLSLSLPLKNMVISQNLALAISIIIVSFWNFFANRYYTYGNVPDGEIIKSDHSRRSSIQETD
jgi:putative flippase GtrA